MSSGTTSAARSGAGTPSPELLVELDRSSRRSLRSQLEEALRQAIRSGRLRAGTRLPASRALALDVGVSRRMVVDAYSQLLAEGYIVARAGAGTYVAEAAAIAPAPVGQQLPRPPKFDFFPGYPDLATFPRRAWGRALRETLRDAPDQALGYPDPRGAPELRAALAEHLRRVRGVVADAETTIVCGGVAQAFALVARALEGARIAVEDPSLPVHREILDAAGARIVPLAVDEHGARVEELPAIAASPGPPLRAVLVTPAHQAPTGVALSSPRRAALVAWAREADALIVEDDYDAEYRYDRAPLGAIQGLAPDRVLYTGSVSKTLAPALRLGWMVVPTQMHAAIAREKALADHGSPTLDQLALARLLQSGAYDSHLRQARRRYRVRRDALVRAVAAHLPGARVTGLAAGLAAIVRLGRPLDALALTEAARRLDVGVYPLGYGYTPVRPRDDGLVLGYANLAEPAIEEGIRRLGAALAEVEGRAALA